MQTLRIAVLAVATLALAGAAVAQSTQQTPPQTGQGGYTCSSKARAPATS
jgi:hypothetical protein